MRQRITAGAVIVVLLGVITTALMGMTLVLGVTGSAGASTWTGTIGAGLLAVWLLSINAKRRPRRKRVVAAPPPLPEPARP